MVKVHNMIFQSQFHHLTETNKIATLASISRYPNEPPLCRHP